MPEELEPTLHRLLDFFGLGGLFASEEGVPPGAEPEPEPAGGAEPEPEPEAAEQPPEDEKELVVAEGEAVDLPPRTIDHVIQARYGSLEEEGKWLDVTRRIGDAVDETGGLQVKVDRKNFGDPAPDAEKTLSIKYKPCEGWEREGFTDALAQLQKVAEAEHAALRRAVKKQRDHELDFEEEKEWVKFFLKGDGRQEAPEVVELDVGAIGDRICVKRSTLMLCADSALARRF